MAVLPASGRVVEPLMQPDGAAPAPPTAVLSGPQAAMDKLIGPRPGREQASRTVMPAGRHATDRSRTDGLALGAPVTAAFVGVMLAKGEFAGAAPAGEEASATATSGFGQDLAGTIAATTGGSAALGAQEEQALEEAAQQTAAVDPISAGAPPAATGQTPSGSEPAAIDTPAPAEGGAALVGQAGSAINISLSSTTLSLDDGLLVGAASGDELAPLGAYAGGAAGDDTLVGTDQSDALAGGAGDDLIYGEGGNDWLDGGDGDDRLFGGDGVDTLLGGGGQDQLDGGADDDRLFGGEGADSLLGGAGRDRLDGGAGNDRLDGGVGADHLTGGAGDDILVVDDRDDIVLDRFYGPDRGLDTYQITEGFSSEAVTFTFGDDLGATLDGTSGDRQGLHGEIENLVLTGTVGHDAIGDGRDNSLIGNAGDNALYGAGGNDLLSGGDGDDLLDGGFGADRIEGGAGSDILSGDSGDDDLWGGSGDDRLTGGVGADRLYGEAGDDTYVIGLYDSAVDTVFDHEGSNHILLEGVTGQSVKTAIVDGDLYLVANGKPVAVVSDYVGHEDSFAGIDLGAGIVAVEDLLANGAGTPHAAAALDVDTGPSEDLLGSYLSRPSLTGADAADQLSGTGGADWLQGLAGNDELYGAAGSDVLEGGAGSDLLRGGAGDDRYLFRSGESGLDTIRDADGSNIAELDGFTGARLEGVVVGHDLIVVADYAPIFKVENYVGNEASFAGVQVDDTFVPSEDLFG